jgi:Helix-turn-helix of DDE superfamily endonuclease
MMEKYESIEKVNAEKFKRTVGLSPSQFKELLSKVEGQIALERSNNPMKKRGIRGDLSTANKLLLTLYYLRHYSTFLLLAQAFGICESYANKIYHRFVEILLKVLHVRGLKALEDNGIESILIDATEQEIERPSRGQKAYYSGKKKTYN